jgi:hypothetical protein
MTVTFEHDNEHIVYAIEKDISYARRTQQIFVAQCGWWLAGIIGLEEDLIIHINKLYVRTAVRKEHTTEEVSDPVTQIIPRAQDSKDQESKEDHQDKILKECEEYLKDSRRLREIAALKATGKTLTGLINPTAISQKHLRKKDRYMGKLTNPPKKYLPELAGIDQAEIKRRRENDGCLRCTWPSNRKGTHRVKDCRRPIKLDKRTASCAQAKRYQGELREEACDAGISSESSSYDSVKG